MKIDYATFDRFAGDAEWMAEENALFTAQRRALNKPQITVETLRAAQKLLTGSNRAKLEKQQQWHDELYKALWNEDDVEKYTWAPNETDIRLKVEVIANKIGILVGSFSTGSAPNPKIFTSMLIEEV